MTADSKASHFPDSQVNCISSSGDGSAVKLRSVDISRLEDLCRACTAFYELVEGQAPTDETAADILGPLDPEYAHGIKHVWGVEMHGDLVAVAELLQGHPTTYEWYIGLLLVTPRRRGEGLGAQFCRMILDRIALRGGATVRLVVHQQNVAAQGFWQKQGFSAERELKKKSGRLHGQVSVFVRSLGRARHAADILRHIRPTWSAAMESEIDHIESGHGALIWAIGCVWAAYVERYWSKTKTAASTTGFVILLVMVVPFSLAFLVWYAVSLGDLGFTGSNPAICRLAVTVSVLALAGIAAPAQWQWRATAAALFPFLAFGAFLATAGIGLKASLSLTSLAWPNGWIWFSRKEGFAGIAFGVTMAAVLALPFSLVYRTRAVLLVTLALSRSSQRGPGTSWIEMSLPTPSTTPPSAFLRSSGRGSVR